LFLSCIFSIDNFTSIPLDVNYSTENEKKKKSNCSIYSDTLNLVFSKGSEEEEREEEEGNNDDAFLNNFEFVRWASLNRSLVYLFIYFYFYLFIFLFFYFLFVYLFIYFLFIYLF
jgi:hypothetical protein